MFGRPPEGGLLSFCDGVGWTAAKCSGVFQRLAEHVRRSFAVRRLRWAPLVGASAAVVRRTVLVCGAALQTSSQTYATNLASSLASSLCAPVSRPYPEMQPHLYRIRLSLLAPNVAYLAHLRYLAVENEGVLPEIRWLSSNECALGCALESSTGVGNEKPQVSALRLLSIDSSMSPAGCHVDENHPISGMLGGSNCTTVRGTKAILLR